MPVNREIGRASQHLPGPVLAETLAFIEAVPAFVEYHLRDIFLLDSRATMASPWELRRQISSESEAAAEPFAEHLPPQLHSLMFVTSLLRLASNLRVVLH